MIMATPEIYDMEQFKKFYKAASGDNLEPGERRMIIFPGFDFRGTKDAKYGQSTPTLMFAERRGNKAIDIQFYMGWCLDGSTHEPLCNGLYFHDDHKTSEYSHDSKDCVLTGGDCFGEVGSALYGDKILARLLAEGSPAMWDEIDKAFAKVELSK